MNIAITFSPNWTCYVAMLIYSIFTNNPAPIKVYVISDELSNDDIKLLDKTCEFFGEGYSYEYINALDTYNKYITTNTNVDGRFSKYVLYRLLFTKMLDKSVDRLLYIDADVICNGDLTKFYNMEFGTRLFYGVLDCGVQDWKPKIGFTPDDVYVNAGVLLMNLNKIRKKDLVDRWIDLANNKWFPMHDQDIINITCKGRIGTVGIEYNTSISTGLKIPENEIKIMHYAGGKPWKVRPVPNYLMWARLRELFKADILRCK